MLSFIAGLVLLFAVALSFMVVKDKVHPACVFPAVWGVSLIILSALPLWRFIPIQNGALVFFVLGGLTFSLISIVTHYLVERKIMPPEKLQGMVENFRPLVLLILAGHAIVFSMALNELLSLGGTLSQAIYQARALQVQGVEVFNHIVTNYMLLGLVLIPLITVARLRKRIGILSYSAVVVPWITMILVTSGRAGLIQLVFAVLFIYYLLFRKVSFRAFVFVFAIFLAVVVAGALAVGKVHIGSHESDANILNAFLKHIAIYAFQGPILFSRYFDGSVAVSAHWNPFTSIQHILTFFGGTPPPSTNLEFNLYGNDPGMLGNVYSIYFSLYPDFGIIGALIILSFYSATSTYIYLRARSGELLYIVISAYLFSAMILSVFADYFLTGLWFFVKVIVIMMLFKLYLMATKKSFYR